MPRNPHAVRFALLATIAALVLAIAPSALAGNGKGAGKPSGGGSSGTGLSLVLLNSTDGLPHYGQQVTFNVSTTATDRPFVSLVCSQNGTLVYSSSAGFFAAYLWPWERNFTLVSTYWTGGAADCTATLYYSDGTRTRNLASLPFHVYA